MVLEGVKTFQLLYERVGRNIKFLINGYVMDSQPDRMVTTR